MKRTQVFYNSLSGAVLFAVNLVVAFLLSPVIVRSLGDRGYGIWEILLSVFGYLSILELGVGPAFIRFVARAAAADDRAGMDRVVSSALALLASAGFAGFVIANALLLLPHRLIHIDPHLTHEVRALGLILGANFLVQLAGTTFSAYLMGMQRHYMMNASRIVLGILQAVVTYYALTRSPVSGLILLSSILLIANIIQFGLFAFYSLARRPSPSIRPAHISRHTIRDLYAFGIKSVTAMASNRLAVTSVPIVMGWVLGTEQIIFYAIPNRLAIYAAGLGAALGFPLMPYFSALDGRGDRAGTLKAWFGSTRALQFVILGMAVGFLGLGGPFISCWIGPQYAEKGAWVIRCLGAALLVEALSPNSNRLLTSMNRHGLPAAISLLIAALGVPLTVFLARVLGMSGVGLSVLLIRGVPEVVWFALALRALGIDAWDHLRCTVVRFVPGVALFGGALYGLRSVHEADNYSRLILYGAVGTSAYLLGVWSFALDKRERGAWRSRFVELFRKLASAA